MSSSLDTFLVLIGGYASMAWSTVSEPVVLGLPDLAWSTNYLQPKWNFCNRLVAVLWSPTSSPFALQFIFASFSGIFTQFKLVNICRRIKTTFYGYKKNVYSTMQSWKKKKKNEEASKDKD